MDYQNFFSSLLDWVYPPLCLHCKEGLLSSQLLLCPSCTELLTLLPLQGRCRKCFSSLSHKKEGVCLSCKELSRGFSRFAACFASMGPAGSLLSSFSLSKQSRFSKDMAAYLTVQHHKLMQEQQWPFPDCIFEVQEPFDPMKDYLGSALARFLAVPYQKELKRRWSSLPRFSLKRRCNIQDQSVLLVCGGVSSLETLSVAAETLRAEGAARVDALAFCV